MYFPRVVTYKGGIHLPLRYSTTHILYYSIRVQALYVKISKVFDGSYTAQ